MKTTQHTKQTILSRIRGHGRGWVFTPRAFTDLADRRAVAVALGRLVAEGKILRMGRGIYSYPKTHAKLGDLLPSVDQIARALAGRDRIRLLPAGAYAANLLGLSEQVPGKVVFLTDGGSRKLAVGNMTIELRKTAPRYMALAGNESGLVIQALRHLGKAHVDGAIVAKLMRALSSASKKELLRNISLAPAWMRAVLTQISGGK